MAIFKVLCFIGFLLLSSSDAREHKGRHRSLHHDHHFRKYRHILKRHLTADQLPYEEHSSKRSEKVEDSSKVWLQKGNEKTLPAKLEIETNRANPDTGFPSGNVLLPSGKKPVGGNGKIVPTKVVTVPGGNKGPEYGASGRPVKPGNGQGDIETPIRPGENQGGQPVQGGVIQPEQVGSGQPGQGGSGQPGQGGSGQPEQVGSGPPGQGGSGQPEQVGSGQPEQVGSGQPGQVGSGQPGQGGSGQPGQGGSGQPGQGGSGQPGQGGSGQPNNQPEGNIFCSNLILFYLNAFEKIIVLNNTLGL